MRAAGLRETKAWTLRIPALLGILAGGVVFWLALDVDPHMPLYGGAASGHRKAMPETFQLVFLMFAAGAVLGGLLGRVRAHTLVIFNVCVAFIEALILSVLLLLVTVAEVQHDGWETAGVFVYAIIWGFPLVIMHLCASLAGRLARWVTLRLIRRRGPEAMGAPVTELAPLD